MLFLLFSSIGWSHATLRISCHTQHGSDIVSLNFDGDHHGPSNRFWIFWCPKFSSNFGVLSHKDGTSPLKLEAPTIAGRLAAEVAVLRQLKNCIEQSADAEAPWHSMADRAMEPSPFPHVENHHWVREQALKKSLSLQIAPIFSYFAKPGFPMHFRFKTTKATTSCAGLDTGPGRGATCFGRSWSATDGQAPGENPGDPTEAFNFGIIHWLCFFRFWVTSSEKNPTWQGEIPCFFGDFHERVIDEEGMRKIARFDSQRANTVHTLLWIFRGDNVAPCW